MLNLYSWPSLDGSGRPTPHPRGVRLGGKGAQESRLSRPRIDNERNRPSGRMPRESDLKRHVRNVLFEIRREGGLPTTFAVKDRLLSKYSMYKKKKQNMLDKLVSKELEELHDLMTTVNLIDVPTPEPGDRHVSMSLMNQRVSANYATSAAVEAANASQDAGSKAPDAKKASTTASPKAAKKRKRPKSSSSKSQSAKGMYMGTADVDAQIAGAIASESYLCKIPEKTFKDVAGLEDVLIDIRKLVGTPLQHPEVFKHLGVSSLHGLLLQGPSGCGKSLLGDAIAGEMG